MTDTNKKRVAIIQNRLQAGGRMHVIMHMIEVLNEMGIEPELLTFRPLKSEEEYQKIYGFSGLRFRIRKIFINPRIPFEWNILVFNFIVNFYLKKYDLVINSNNTSFFLRKRWNLLSYCHFPRKARLRFRKKDIHFPEGKNKSIWDWKTDLLGIARSLYKFDKRVSPGETIIANSKFTAKTIEEHYNVSFGDIHVIYPPVDSLSTSDVAKERDLIVSLGRFSPDKRQLEQIKLAAELPSLTFVLIGFVNDQSYFDTCREYIEFHDIRNVRLMPNASNEEIEQNLNKAQFFLHTLINEPFGITVVQAIDRKCIPLVHNSGGPVEIVPFEELRYEDDESLRDALLSLHEKSDEELDYLVDKLVDHSRLFRKENFAGKLKEVIGDKLKVVTSRQK